MQRVDVALSRRAVGTPAAVAWRGAALVVALGLLSLGVWGTSPTPYVSSQWLFTYGAGLVRRSAVGTLWEAAGGDVGTSLVVAAVGVYVAAVIALALGGSRAVLDRQGRAHVATPLVVALLLAPSGLPALAAGLGRLDTVVVLLLVGAVVLARRPSRVALVGVTTLLLLAVLVHEAAVIVVPWVAVVAMIGPGDRSRSHDAASRAAIVAIPPVLLAGVLALHTPAVDQASLAATLAPGQIPLHNRLLAAGIHHRGLSENLWLVSQFVPRYGLVAGVADLASVLPVVMMVVLTLREAGMRVRDLSSGQWMLLAASLAPLALCGVALDWGRWVSAAASLLGASVVLLLLDAGRTQRRPSRLLWVGVALTVVVTLVAGGTQEHALGLSYVR